MSNETNILNIKVNGQWVGVPAIKGEDGLGVPAGGTTGQVLKKKSNADNDTEWGAVTVPTKTSDLTNDSGFITNSYHDSTKQDTLVSGTNIKTVNNNSLLGSGDIEINALPIGTIYSVTCTPDYVPNGALPCDGAEYSKSQFNDLWTNYLTAQTPLLKTCTYAEYATAISTYGSCPMFAIDSVNNKFKVPTIKDGAYITQAKSDSELGKSYNESLPNITGTTTTNTTPNWGVSGSGVFSGTAYGGATCGYAGSSTQISKYDIKFSAHNSNSVYQDNAKVQGDNVRLRYFVQVATGQINQSQMDWSAWASGLASKADLSNFTEINPMVTTYINGTSGYNIWANGYCEQWGQITKTSEYFTVNLLKTFANTDYTAYAQVYSITDNWSSNPITISVKTVNSFHIGQTYNPICMWKACGYLAEGEY